MYIAPQTNIKLLRNVPISNNYEHTLYFSTASAQYSYFAGLVKYNLTNYTYQRVQKGVARVGLCADNIYDCNYMMFQNTGFGSKWFYAFITGIEYVNNDCSDVYFELDVMQTWFFDMNIKQCFVEREHSETDLWYQHLEPEHLALGEYVFNDYKNLTNMGGLAVVIAAVDVRDTIAGCMYDGIFGSAVLWAYNADDPLCASDVNAKIMEYTQNQKADAIIAIYMVPKSVIGSIPENHLIPETQKGVTQAVYLTPLHPDTDTIDGYQPKNKKLFSYPYNYIHVDNSNGSSMSLRYEFFMNHVPILQVSGTLTMPVQVTCRPSNYKNVNGYLDGGPELKTVNAEILSIGGFPMCSWQVDAYQAWIAQNAVPLAMNAVSDVGEIALAGISGNAGAAASGVGKVTGMLSQFYQTSMAADISHGSFNNGGVNCANRKQQFYVGRASITAKYARQIDDFFTVYGYACNRVKVPNISSRPKWNYVKTVDAVVTGSVPADDLAKICSIFDKGVTFWKNGSEVGNYSLNNAPS